jgi:hypothetical protein
VKTWAEFSPCRTWRYLLGRQWDESLPTIVFVGLNPSTADETQDDPTIRRCIAFAKSWGYGTLLMVNLFAFRATDPREMMAASDPVGPDNDRYLRNCNDMGTLVVAAWGATGGFKNRDREVVQLLERLGCLGTTKAGYPRHPLYLRADLKPRPYNPERVF